jgi:hypothetical protein
MRTITSDQDLTDHEKTLMSCFGGMENLMLMCGASNFTAPDDSDFYSWIRFEIDEKTILVSRLLNRTVKISFFAKDADTRLEKPDSSCRCLCHDVPEAFAKFTGYHLDF